MLEVITSQVADFIVVRPTGRIDSASAKLFEDSLSTAMQSAHPKIIIDLAGVDYVSSAGLRVFLTAAKKAKENGRGMTICSVEPHVREIFDVTGFSSLLGVHATLDDACCALERSR